MIMKEYPEAHINKNFMEGGSYPAGAQILFVKTPEGGLRFCVDS